MTLGALSFSSLNQPAQTVAVFALGDQNGVVGRHHDEILDAEQRDELLVGGYIGAARIDELDGAKSRTLRGIAGGVMARQLPHRLPRTDIRPAIGDRHHGGAFGALHHRIVDRFRGGTREGFRIERDEAEIVAGLVDRGDDGVDTLRLEAAIFVEQEARRGT